VGLIFLGHEIRKEREDEQDDEIKNQRTGQEERHPHLLIILLLRLLSKYQGTQILEFFRNNLIAL
jgi:hypothetical protein